MVTVEACALTNLTRGLVSGNHYASREIQLPAVAGVEEVGRLADVSAWMSLDYAAAARPGAHVLVLGATGVTGSVAVQLAKSVFGAQRVVAAGRNVEWLQWLRAVGADVIAPGEDDLGARVAAAHAEQSFDAVLDYLWGEPAEKVLTALASANWWRSSTPRGSCRSGRWQARR
ncbi:MAG: putative quinone oxidoreductase [Mycobacterium sp.]|nr:putative quinone oxidoreductase [Mycobacterium sp.]